MRDSEIEIEREREIWHKHSSWQRIEAWSTAFFLVEKKEKEQHARLIIRIPCFVKDKF